MNTENNENSKRLIKTILYSTGYALVVLGSFVVVSPSFVMNFTGIDSQTALFTGIALVFAGISDLLISRFLFKNIDRK